MKVTVVGAGKYGSTTVQRLAERDLADEIVMTDIVEGLPQGLALDMNQTAPLEGFSTRVVGTNSYEETAGSDVCVITAGLPRKPGMSRMDLLETNAKIVGDVTEQLVAHSPDTVLIVVSNPLDEMTALAAKISGFPHARVMGQAGMLDSARFRWFVAEAAGVTPDQVEAITLGSHGDTMVPVPSLAKVSGRPLDDVLDQGTIDKLVQRTRDGGAEIVGLLKTGSAYYAPSAAAAQMVEAVLTDSGAVMPVCAWVEGQYGVADVYLGVPARLGYGGVTEIVGLLKTGSAYYAPSAAAAQMVEAVLTDSGAVMPVCAWVEGQYGVADVYLGVPARLGQGGVTEVVELPLTGEELSNLREAAEAVRAKQADLDKIGG